MKLKFLTVGLLAAVALPGIAAAQETSGCLRSNQASNTEGTLLGAAGGALAGSALAGKHDRGIGAVLGALGGGVIGNRVANARNDPCPTGYYRDPNYQPAYAQPQYAPQQPAYAQPRPEYVQPQPAYGYDHQDRGDRGYDRGGDRGYGREHSVSERIDWLRERISRSVDEGRLSRYQARSAYRELGSIRDTARRLNYRDGGQLDGRHQEFLQGRLDALSQRVRGG